MAVAALFTASIAHANDPNEIEHRWRVTESRGFFEGDESNSLRWSSSRFHITFSDGEMLIEEQEKVEGGETSFLLTSYVLDHDRKRIIFRWEDKVVDMSYSFSYPSWATLLYLSGSGRRLDLQRDSPPIEPMPTVPTLQNQQ